MDRNLTYAAAGNQKDREESPTWQPTYEPDIPMSGGEEEGFLWENGDVCSSSPYETQADTESPGRKKKFLGPGWQLDFSFLGFSFSFLVGGEPPSSFRFSPVLTLQSFFIVWSPPV